MIGGRGFIAGRLSGSVRTVLIRLWRQQRFSFLLNSHFTIRPRQLIQSATQWVDQSEEQLPWARCCSPCETIIIVSIDGHCVCRQFKVVGNFRKVPRPDGEGSTCVRTVYRVLNRTKQISTSSKNFLLIEVGCSSQKSTAWLLRLLQSLGQVKIHDTYHGNMIMLVLLGLAISNTNFRWSGSEPPFHGNSNAGRQSELCIGHTNRIPEVGMICQIRRFSYAGLFCVITRLLCEVLICRPSSSFATHFRCGTGRRILYEDGSTTTT